MNELNDEYLLEKFDLTTLSFDEWYPSHESGIFTWFTAWSSYMKGYYAGLHNELNYWSKEPNWVEKRKKAGAVLPRLLSILLFPYFQILLPRKHWPREWALPRGIRRPISRAMMDETGSTVPAPDELGTVTYRMDRIGSRIPEFERLFFLVISEMGGKFYRDHINHVLRVMLLSNHLSEEIYAVADIRRLFGISKEEFETKIRIPLVLSSLYHDLAYPISEISKMPKYLKTILHGCYGVKVDIPKFPKARIKKAALSSMCRSFFRPNSQSSARLESEFEKAVSEHQHGILAALDFLKFFQEDMGKNQEFDDLIFIAAQAMALHDAFMSKENPEQDVGIIPFVEYPVAFLLILCDELQDWGRPIGDNLPPILSSIGFDVSLGPDGRILIKADLDFSKACEGFSPFQQYKSKVDGLRRLTCDPKQGPLLDITIRIPEFRKKKWHTQRSRTDIDDALKTERIEIDGRPSPTDYLEMSEVTYHTLNEMLINEKTKEIYDINRETDEDNFNKLRKAGLKINTCDCANMIGNFRVSVESQGYLFKDFASPLGEFHLRSTDGGWKYEPETSPLHWKLRPQRWTRLLSLDPSRCYKCGKGYQDFK